MLLTPDEAVLTHPFVEERRWFSTTVRCLGCSYSKRLWHGIAFPLARAFTEAGHWAGLSGVEMFRSVENIHAGR